MSFAPWSTEMDRFLAMVLASHLVKTEDLRGLFDAFIKDLVGPTTVVSFGDYLVAHHALTQWQCTKILNGQFLDFFLDDYKFLYHPVFENPRYIAEDTKTNRCVALMLKPWSPAAGRIEYTVVEIPE